MLKRFAEIAARNRRIRRTLPNGSKIYLSPDSQLKYLKRSFDEDLINLGQKHSAQNAVVWDIGANCGVFAFSLNQAKLVLVVEADPFLVTLLQDTALMNGLPVVIIPAAVYDQNGMAEFAIAQRGRASNHLVAAGGNSQSGGERSRLTIPTIMLDQLLDRYGPPTFVKIDVEGAEIEVLSGATRLLRDARPEMYFEANSRTFPICEKILRNAGYTLQKGAEMNWTALPA